MDIHGVVAVVDEAYAGFLARAEAHALAGEYDRAAEVYLQAVEAYPREAEAYCRLAEVLWSQGKPRKAVAILDHAVGVLPGSLPSWRKLGVLAMRMGDHGRALQVFQRCRALAPDDAAVYVELGRLYEAKGMPEEAVTHYRQALERLPAQPWVASRLAVIRLETGHPQEALNEIDRCIARHPDYGNGYQIRGMILKALGDMEGARRAFEDAIERDPTNGQIYKHLFSVYRCEPDAPWIARIQRQLDALGPADERREGFCFALARAYEQIGDYEAAFARYQEANRLHRQAYPYDVERIIGLIDQWREVFHDALMSRLQGDGVDDATPIFIVGMPRSGTSLTEQILASHPQVFGAGELPQMLMLLKQHVYEREAGASIAANVERFARPGTLAAVAREYLQYIHTLAPDAHRITDKLPHNFQHLGLIRVMFPRAKIIHCMRHPVDNCLSLFKLSFSTGHHYMYDLEALGRYYAAYHRLMAHWRRIFPDGFLDFSYEALVADQQGRTGALLAYCDLPWDEACLEFHRSDRPVLTASDGQVRRPIYRDSVRGWRRYEKQLKPLIEILRAEGVPID